MKPPRSPQTGPPPERSWWIVFLALSAGAFLLWSPVLTGLLGTRWLWERFEPRLAARADHALEAALFAVDPDAQHGTLVFGDAEFVAAVSAAVEAPGTRPLLVETDRLETVADLLEALAPLRFERVLVQDRPSFWSSYEATRPPQRLAHWRFHALGERHGGARAFWQAVSDWAAGPAAPIDPGDPWLEERLERTPEHAGADPGSLLNVEFAFPPPRQRGVVARLAAAADALGDRLVWVSDETGLPADTSPGLLAGYRAAVADPGALAGLGRHVPLADFVAGRSR